MINVVVYQNKAGDHTGFTVEGHAEYAEEGSDIICAGVSFLVINTLNAIEAFTDDDFSVTSDKVSGRICCEFEKKLSHDAELLLKTMINGLSDMRDNENYKEYIDLTFEEV